MEFIDDYALLPPPLYISRIFNGQTWLDDLTIRRLARPYALAAKDWLLVLLNPDGNHWILVVLQRSTGYTTVYDSASDISDISSRVLAFDPNPRSCGGRGEECRY